MAEWIPIEEEPPVDQELILWLGPEPGSDEPVGQVIAAYKVTSMGSVWSEKSVSGNINTGLRASLITHYKFLEDGPNGEPSCPEKIHTLGSVSSMG